MLHDSIGEGRLKFCLGWLSPQTPRGDMAGFKCKTCLAKYDLVNLICEEFSYTMTWYEEKTDLKRAWRFLRTNKNSPLEILYRGYSV